MKRGICSDPTTVGHLIALEAALGFLRLRPRALKRGLLSLQELVLLSCLLWFLRICFLCGLMKTGLKKLKLLSLQGKSITRIEIDTKLPIVGDQKWAIWICSFYVPVASGKTRSIICSARNFFQLTMPGSAWWQMLDRFEQHTLKCSSCNSGYESFQTLEKFLIRATVFFGPATGIPPDIRLRVSLATLASISAGLAYACKELHKNFIFVDCPCRKRLNSSYMMSFVGCSMQFLQSPNSFGKFRHSKTTLQLIKQDHTDAIPF